MVVSAVRGMDERLEWAVSALGELTQLVLQVGIFGIAGEQGVQQAPGWAGRQHEGFEGVELPGLQLAEGLLVIGHREGGSDGSVFMNKQ